MNTLHQAVERIALNRYVYILLVGFADEEELRELLEELPKTETPAEHLLRWGSERLSRSDVIAHLAWWAGFHLLGWRTPEGEKVESEAWGLGFQVDVNGGRFTSPPVVVLDPIKHHEHLLAEFRQQVLQEIALAAWNAASAIRHATEM